MSDFFLTILYVALYSAILSTIIGAVVYMGRTAGIAGALSHAILGGVGLATWLSISLWVGAFFAAFIVALILSFVSLYNPGRLEMISNITWGGGMALGILFTSFAPGYQQNLSNFLFGNIVLVSALDGYLMLGIIIFCVFILLLFGRQFLLLWFSPVFARVQNLNLYLLWFLSLFIVALGVISLVKTVGIALVLVLITVPGHIARFFFSSFLGVLGVSFAITLAAILLGLTLSYFFSLPAGASVALSVLGFYLFPFLIKKRAS